MNSKQVELIPQVSQTSRDQKSNQTQISIFPMQDIKSKNKKKYGNMKVLLETQNVLITLGPDYGCFIAGFIIFLVCDYFLVSIVNSAFQNIYLKIGNIVLAVSQLLSYLWVAVSNPGIVLQQNLPSQQNDENEQTKRYCRKCQIRMYKNMYHCKYCDVCIRDYDHHCPWTSKCIGGSNIGRFNFFITITPIYIIYFIIMLLVGLASYPYTPQK